MKKISLLFLIIIASSVANAKVGVDNIFSICAPYPNLKDLRYVPEKFNYTNNLARPVENSFYDAEGKKIIIYGRIMDSNCTPLNDAKIYIWQANTNGFIQFNLKDKAKIASTKKIIDPNFAGNGIANSDNLGRFNFTTIMPGTIKKTTPVIYFTVEHPFLKTFSSKFYITHEDGQKITDTGPNNKIFTITNQQILSQVSAVLANKNDKIASYNLDITLHEELPNKGY